MPFIPFAPLAAQALGILLEDGLEPPPLWGGISSRAADVTWGFAVMRFLLSFLLQTIAQVLLSVVFPVKIPSCKTQISVNC